MSSAKAEGPQGSRRFSSIARSINWGFWWRRLLNYLFFDVILVVVAAVTLVYGYNQTLPAGTIDGWLVPADGVVAKVTGSDEQWWDLSQVRYFVEPTSGKARSFDLGPDLLTFWPVAAVALVWELTDLLGMLGDTRRIRRALLPLNDLALKAEELGNANLSDLDKMESLEQAIERASVDSPQVSTGDQDLASIEVALNRLLRQMQEAKVQQMRFVNDASHELRTPIAVIQGYVNMLDRWGKTDEAVLDESIASLKAESEHMQELVEQLLFLARGDSGRNAPDKVVVNLAGLVEEVQEESAIIDEGHDYRLGFAMAACGDTRYEVVGDVAMLKQAMRAIVQNAAKYSATGTQVSFGIDASDGMVRATIQDEGIGMSAEAANHAFERFYRADNARDGGEGGSGLGLSIAKWIVDSHGGTIEVLSREGVGTRFTISVPAAVDAVS